ncbi:MAG: peptide-methionine (S)-S-oxide reductase MsrA [Pseudomonadota bacterium]|nr:peptide-methionine (S)-S-oxide reductase MsrA [Pseudomonadota bacterium]
MSILFACFALYACAVDAAPPARGVDATVVDDNAPAAIPAPGPGQGVAVFAGGCFWCLESDFDKLDGIVQTTSGYAGGHVKNPTYRDVTSETSGHKEVVRVVYDTSKLTYDQVLDYYWHHIDPLDVGGQFCDRGDSYESAIYVVDDAQKKAAFASKAAIDARKVLASPIVTPILPLDTFWAAENYHQDFHDKNPGRYLPYRMGCGRDLRVAEVWANEKQE